MRIAITGATGNVGTSLVQALVDDAEVTSIVGVARRLPGWRPPRTTWVQADVARDDLLSPLRGAHAVVHLAWLFQPTHRPDITWATNVRGSLRVFDAAARAGVGTLVYASSVGTYAPGPKDEAVDESWPATGIQTCAITVAGDFKTYVYLAPSFVNADFLANANFASQLMICRGA